MLTAKFVLDFSFLIGVHLLHLVRLDGLIDFSSTKFGQYKSVFACLCIINNTLKPSTKLFVSNYQSQLLFVDQKVFANYKLKEIHGFAGIMTLYL